MASNKQSKAVHGAVSDALGSSTPGQFNAEAVQQELRLSLVAGVSSAAARAKAKGEAATMSQHLLSVAVMCRTAAVFETQMGIFGDWLKSAEGIGYCREKGIKLQKNKADDGFILPGTFKQYQSNILKAMRQHEDKALRKDGVPLVPHISTFKAETDVRKAVTSPNVREAAALADVQTRQGLSDEQRNAAAHEVMVRAALGQRLDRLKERALFLKGERSDEGLKAVTAALDAITVLWDAQRKDEADAAAAQKEAERQAASLPGATVENGAGVVHQHAHTA